MAGIIIAGFGGQGVLVLGQMITYAGMIEDKAVSWFPSYGPEQRGGTCNCSVVISDEEIGSPIVSRPDTAIVMNAPSFDRFEPEVAQGGLFIYNSTLIHKQADRDDIRVVAVPANEIAEELGNARVANMVLLGSFIENTGLLDIASVEKSLAHVLSERHHHLIPLNMKALERGRAYQ
ncbi:MAG TPA: 2-oxoacid:ferredoxin oxidoreductase subunit gamma [Firmicutes bacterium]|nr:2-oxoacid:ferredoxin oxidoreductase subunit gamma [Bacillota bacterium]